MDMRSRCIALYDEWFWFHRFLRISSSNVFQLRTISESVNVTGFQQESFIGWPAPRRVLCLQRQYNVLVERYAFIARIIEKAYCRRLILHGHCNSLWIILSRDWVTIERVKFVVGSIQLLHNVITNNYSAIANSHTLQFARARTKPSRAAVFLPVISW
jgi:hypothetical protein